MVLTLIWTIRFEFCDVICAIGAVCICVPSGRVGRLLVTPWIPLPMDPRNWIHKMRDKVRIMNNYSRYLK